MKVKELKKLLENYSDDAPVLIYEGGIIQDLLTQSVTDEVRQALKEYHNINADAEVEQVRRKEYEFYINGGVEE
jgi:hypothetical protein